MKAIGSWLGCFFSVILVVFFLVGCSSLDKNKTAEETETLKVVATNSIIADIAKNIGKDRITVHSIVPVGKNPHEYEPLPKDIKKTAETDLIFYNGLNLETGGNAWFEKLVKNTRKRSNKDYYAVSDGVRKIYLEGKAEKGKEDPHAWMDLKNGMIYAKNIEKQLSAKDPKNKAFYKKNRRAYVKKLNVLHNKAKREFGDIPTKKKMIVTSEGSFRYFSRAYNIPSIYIWGINTEQEGTPRQLERLISRLTDSSIPVLFVENSVDERSMKTVSKDTGIPIYSELFTDSVAEKGRAGDSYYAMMKWNLEKIISGLSQ
ncbi:manganese ABC transporter substrate binding protein [Liquorilactobacillus aquaticus DSM 21051]|uniref:Manganese ABC transporter substrate binding protein n=1 Tax=Liquorilactobacillus aquaticus DSM 21051 TaxID=1423725 RepID=A0A0R2D2Z4_9LACO|nr:metal ABC transporter substrate-binding protein [Liquorilactobacillus aquaticus]KRM94953.1 manganese ABC transporter substrate binding protein [Liquorilactobacillus aquaticus DSM 21051]